MIVKCAVIGLGIGERHLQSINQNINAHLVAICDLDSKKLEEIANKYEVKKSYTDYKVMLNQQKIDLVIIASFDDVHFEQIITCFELGINVFVEKPICLQIEQLDELKSARKRNNIKYVGCNFILRREKLLLKLKSEIQSGTLGDVYLIESSYDYGRWYKVLNGWRGKISNYSVMLGGGVHMIDLIQWLCSQNIRHVNSYSSDIISKLNSVKFPDLVMSVGRLKNDALVKINSNFGCVSGHFHQLKVYGSKGTFSLDSGTSKYFLSYDDNRKYKVDYEKFPIVHKGLILSEFIDAISLGSPPPILFEEICSATEYALISSRSALKDR